MLRPDAQANQSGGQTLQHRYARDNPQREWWRELPTAGKNGFDKAVLHLELETLGDASRPGATALHGRKYSFGHCPIA